MKLFLSRMDKTGVTAICLIAALLILIGLQTWTVPTTHAFVAVAGINPSEMMTTAKNLPTSHYDDYFVVFNRSSP